MWKNKTQGENIGRSKGDLTLLTGNKLLDSHLAVSIKSLKRLIPFVLIVHLGIFTCQRQRQLFIIINISKLWNSDHVSFLVPGAGYMTMFHLWKFIEL